MSTQSQHHNTTELTDQQIQQLIDTEEQNPPHELESAFMTIAMFMGLVVFGIGCMTFLW